MNIINYIFFSESKRSEKIVVGFYQKKKKRLVTVYQHFQHQRRKSKSLPLLLFTHTKKIEEKEFLLFNHSYIVLDSKFKFRIGLEIQIPKCRARDRNTDFPLWRIDPEFLHYSSPCSPLSLLSTSPEGSSSFSFSIPSVVSTVLVF